MLAELVQAPAGTVTATHVNPVTAPAGATCVSTGATDVNVWLPVFVTVNVSVMTSPTALTLTGLADFTVVNEFAGVTGTLTGGDGGLITGGSVGFGGVPVDVAESFTDPASRSACVTAYVAVKVAT